MHCRRPSPSTPAAPALPYTQPPSPPRERVSAVHRRRRHHALPHRPSEWDTPPHDYPRRRGALRTAAPPQRHRKRKTGHSPGQGPTDHNMPARSACSYGCPRRPPGVGATGTHREYDDSRAHAASGRMPGPATARPWPWAEEPGVRRPRRSQTDIRNGTCRQVSTSQLHALQRQLKPTHPTRNTTARTCDQERCAPDCTTRRHSERSDSARNDAPGNHANPPTTEALTHRHPDRPTKSQRPHLTTLSPAHPHPVPLTTPRLPAREQRQAPPALPSPKNVV